MAQRLSSVWVIVLCLHFAHINPAATTPLPTSIYAITQSDTRQAFYVGLCGARLAVNNQSPISINGSKLVLGQFDSTFCGRRAQSCSEKGSPPDHVVMLDDTFCADSTGVHYSSTVAAGCIAGGKPSIVTPLKAYPRSGGTYEFVALASSDDGTGRQLRRGVVDGEKIANLPSAVENGARSTFEWHQMPQLETSDSNSPQGKETRSGNVTLWEQYRWEIVSVAAVVLLQGAMIAALLQERRRRRVAETVTQRTISELLRLNRMVTAGELSVSIAHEVNQPLAGIVANANAGMRWLTSETPDIVKAGAAFKQIVDAGHHASDVIASVRALVSRRVEERLPLEINELIRHAILLERLELEKYRVSLTIELGESLPEIVGDRVQLLQVVLNLVRNAIEAMEAKSTRILRIVSQTDESGGVLVSIEDTGLGMDEQELSRIFDSFFTTKAHGLGIGLSICRSIIDSHDGRLWATSAVGRGSVFHVKLPKYRLGDGWMDRRMPRERVLGGDGRCLRP